jgi:hypothetical protein
VLDVRHNTNGLICLLAILTLTLPGSGLTWGDDGHFLVLENALAALPADSRRIYETGADRIRTYALEPDRHSTVPAEGSKHFIDIELLDPSFLSSLTTELKINGAAQGLADEDARGIAILLERTFFVRQPLPWSDQETAQLWEKLPPGLPGFRAAYPGLETIMGTVVYQPFLYTRALARAIRRGDQRWIQIYAGMLVHYTGDLYVPLHVTANYKGQFSGNLIFDDARKGHGDVHARFEIAFLKHRLESIRAAVATARREPKPLKAAEINAGAIAAARLTYAQVEPILVADREAAAKYDPARAWPRYAAEVGPVFEPVVARQIAAASAMLADLLLTAATMPLDSPAVSGKIGTQ